MIRSLLIWGFLLLVFTACGKPKANVKYTLTDDQLSHLMFDVQLAEVAVSEVGEDAQRDSIRDLLWTKLEAIYKLPASELTAEIRKLESDPEKMKVIMDRAQVLADSIR